MQKKLFAIGLGGLVGLACSSAAISWQEDFTISLWESVASAQIVPDNHLPTPPTLRAEGSTSLAESGSRFGTNLFYTFTDFSVPAGSQVSFDNATGVQNIIVRVTGDRISEIDGLLRANGNANILFVNPNGIAFGPEATLDVDGSFVASSAESLVFADGTVLPVSVEDFPAERQRQRSPYPQTASSPVGLQLGDSPGAIRVAGTGHNITEASHEFTENTSLSRLQVGPERTLAFVGGEIDLEGGVLIAESGRIELGGVADTTVNLNAAAKGWTLSYAEGANFQPVRFSQAALADVSGQEGSIQIRGDRLYVTDLSLLLAWHGGAQTGGSIDLGVTDSIEIVGIQPMQDGIRRRSGIIAGSSGAGNAGNINLSARDVLLEDGSLIWNIAVADGRAGDINIAATDFVRLSFSSDPTIPTLVATETFGPSGSGDLHVTARRVILEDGGGANCRYHR